MDSDFSKAEAGDWAWTIKQGWSRVAQIDALGDFPLQIAGSTYTMNGKLFTCDECPSAFLVPPSDFNAGSHPCELEEGDKVVVWDYECYKRKTYFSHFEEGNTYKFHCFTKGDKWSSDGKTTGWRYCEKWEGL